MAQAFSVARLAPEQIPDPEDAANLVVRAVEAGACLLLQTELGKEVASDLEELTALSNGLRDGGRVPKTVRDARVRYAR